MSIFEIPCSEAALADDEPMRDSHEFRVGEFDSRPGVPVVEQHVDAGIRELLVQGVGSLLDPRRLLIMKSSTT